MAVSSSMYINALKHIKSKQIDLVSDDIRVALLTNSYSPSQSHEYWSHIATNQVSSGNGYESGGKSLVNKNLSVDTIGKTVSYFAGNVTWENSTITARYAVIYNNTPLSGSAKQLICYIDFGENKSSLDGNFTITWNAEGIFRTELA